MTYDGRITAWIAAWQRLLAIEDAKRDLGKRRVEVPQAFVDQNLAKAEVLARLAQADASVGLAAGEWLREEDQRRVDEASRRAEDIASFMEKATEKGKGE